MTRLRDIGIRVEGAAGPATGASANPAPGPGGLGGGVAALLTELATLLERLASDGRPGVIDVRSLPLSPEERLVLRRTLGEGEVQAKLTVDGPSDIRETGVPGVWWIEHHDADGRLTAEFLDIACVPELLRRTREEVADGARDLRGRLAARQ